MDDHGTEKSDLNVGLVGLGLGIVWIALVTAFSYWLAI